MSETTTASTAPTETPSASTSPADIVRAAWASAYIQTPTLLDRLTDDEVLTLWERHMSEDLSPHLFDDGSTRKQAYRKRGDEIITNYLMLRTAATAHPATAAA